MEHCLLGITRRNRKRLEWIGSTTQITDVIHRIRSVKWNWEEHIARRSCNSWTTRITYGIQELPKDQEDVHIYDKIIKQGNMQAQHSVNWSGFDNHGNN